MMNHRVRSAPRSWCALLLSLVLLFLAGCSRDPNVKKQKYLESGKRYAAEKKYREAAIQYQNALQVDGRYADAHYELAKLYMALGSWQAAYGELSRVIALQPNNLHARLDLADIFVKAQQYPQAAEQVDFVLSKDANSVEGHVLQGRIEAGRGDVDGGIGEVQLAIKLDPARAESYWALSEIQYNAKRFADAEASVKKTLELNPKLSEAWVSLASVYAQQNRLAEAGSAIQSAIKVNPGDVRARETLARYYLMSGKRAEAEDVMRQAAKDIPDDPQAYWMIADFYRDSGQTDKALAEYQRLRQQYPKDRHVLTNYIDMLVASNRIDDASKLVAELLKKNDKDPDALMAQSRILNRQGNPREAADVVARALKLEPDSARAHYEAGQSYDALGDTSRAETEFREAARRNPNMFAAQEALASVALREQKFDLLGDTAEHMLKLQPANGNAYVLRSAAKFAKKDYAGAEADLQTALRLAGDSPVVYARLGEYRMSQKKYPEAEKYFEQALDKKPDLQEAMQGLVILYATIQKDPAKAVARLNAQIAKAPQNSGFYTTLGALQMQTNHPDLAEQAWSKATQLDSKNVEATLNLAGLYSSRGQPDKAIALYEHVAQIRPADDRAYVLLGNLYLARKDFPKAEQNFRKVLQLQPDSAIASNNLAYALLLQDKDIDYAVSLAQVAHQKLPDSPGASDSLAWAYYKKGAYGLAIDLLEGAIKRAPKDPDLEYHLGMAYQKNSDPERARLHLQKALQLDPSNARNQEIQKTLDGLKKG